MIWAGIRDHLAGDMTPLDDMPSSLVVYLSVLLIWSSIQRPNKRVILWIMGGNNYRNMGDQRNLREVLKVWRLVQF